MNKFFVAGSSLRIMHRKCNCASRRAHIAGE